MKKADGTVEAYKPSVAVMKRLASRWPKPKWHAPWKTYRVISGHLGWASSIAFEPGNEWFATGSGDRTVKIWDTASGTLKLTLTGHTEQVTGLAVSDQFPYMFSCGLDKKVMCWDLEQNKVCLVFLLRMRMPDVCERLQSCRVESHSHAHLIQYTVCSPSQQPAHHRDVRSR